MIYAFLKALSDRNSYSQAINSLKTQVDHVYCAVDKEVDYQDDKVTFFVTGNENADLDKFLILSEVKLKHNDHVFICDDDLIYPSDYVSYTISQSKKLNSHIISYGGSWFSEFPIASYYSEKNSIPIFTKHSNYQAQIPYSGVFYFRVTKETKPLVEALKVKGDTHLPFASDITVALLLGGLKLECLCLSPKQFKWFKHIEIDMSCTIFESFKNNDFEQTVMLNRNSHLLPDFSHEVVYPKISVVFVVTRIKTQRDIVVEALSSLKKQIYPNYEIVWIENYDKMKTIGKCFNEGVQESTGEWVLFFADDDIIMPDYLATIAGAIMGVQEDIVNVTTGITMFNAQEETKMDRAPTGCWKREFLLENPFIEWANRFVDTEMFTRAAKREKNVVVLKHSHGYLYRSHVEQASGMKSLSNDASDDKHFIRMNQLMKDTFGEIE